MSTLLYLSLTLNIILFCVIVRNNIKKRPSSKKDESNDEKINNVSTDEPPVKTNETPAATNSHSLNRDLYTLAKECEEKLDPQFKGLIKILVEKNAPTIPAALKVGDVKLSLKRNEKIYSYFSISSPREALYIARDGYERTGRYIPVPKEVEYILAHTKAINVYLTALNLDKICNSDDFVCIQTETGWISGWKRFNWNIERVLEKLKNNFKVHTSEGYKPFEDGQSAKVFVLLQGWEYLFVEV